MWTKSDEYIYKVESYLMKKYGVDTADRELYPLAWYIRTGRASTLFLRKLYEKKPYMIGRILHAGGSVDEIVDRIVKYVFV